MPRCHKCNSSDYIDTARYEQCRRCGYCYHYGDAHATGDAQISREVSPGNGATPLPDPPPERKDSQPDLPPGWEFDDQAFLNGY